MGSQIPQDGNALIRALVAMATLMALLVLVHAGLVKTPRLAGTFIQLNSSHLQWKPEQWQELFMYFQEMRLKSLVVQWSIYDGVKFFDTTGRGSPIETVLRLADENEMEVSLGLGMDSLYWKKIEETPEEIRAYLNQSLISARKVADELNSLFNKYVSFTGWYIPQEVDDVHWMDDPSRQILLGYLQALTSYLRAISPDKYISLSGFAVSENDSKKLEKFWTILLASTEVDRVLFQDGIGTKSIQDNNLPVFFEPVRKAAEASSKEFHLIVEVFRQIAGVPVNNGPFQAVPASWSRVRQQFRVGGSRVRSLIAFSVPEYMTPLGGEQAEILYSSYLQFIHKETEDE